jgi:hypothetical protein
MNFDPYRQNELRHFECTAHNYLKMKKLTNTFELIHRNEQNTNKTSYFAMKEFPTPHALSI